MTELDNPRSPYSTGPRCNHCSIHIPFPLVVHKNGKQRCPRCGQQLKLKPRGNPEYRRNQTRTYRGNGGKSLVSRCYWGTRKIEREGESKWINGNK